MAATSAGLLLYRRGVPPRVFLVHPGGPYWAAKDQGAWSVPKGLVNPAEDELGAARREFQEETGFDIPTSAACDLGVFRLPGGKRLRVWALEGDCDPAHLTSNLFSMEWPPGSGRVQQFPEVDRGAWFEPTQALAKVTRGQRAVLEKFYAALGS